MPASQKLDLIVEFPDKHKRSLVRTTLYVDGKITAENKAEPFDSFTWDLSGYKLSGEHKLVVEAVDSLGLNKTSMEIPVTVTVIEAPHGISAVFGRYRQQITFGAVGFAGLVLVLILFMARFRNTFVGARSARQAQADPVTQPVPVVLERHKAKEAAARRGRAVASSGVLASWSLGVISSSLRVPDLRISMAG